MANQRISKDKRALVLAMLSEGTPINAVGRVLGVAKETVLRVIEARPPTSSEPDETGAVEHESLSPVNRLASPAFQPV